MNFFCKLTEERISEFHNKFQKTCKKNRAKSEFKVKSIVDSNPNFHFKYPIFCLWVPVTFPRGGVGLSHWAVCINKFECCGCIQLCNQRLVSVVYLLTKASTETRYSKVRCWVKNAQASSLFLHLMEKWKPDSDLSLRVNPSEFHFLNLSLLLSVGHCHSSDREKKKKNHDFHRTNYTWFDYSHLFRITGQGITTPCG